MNQSKGVLNTERHPSCFGILTHASCALCCPDHVGNCQLRGGEPKWKPWLSVSLECLCFFLQFYDKSINAPQKWLSCSSWFMGYVGIFVYYLIPALLCARRCFVSLCHSTISSSSWDLDLTASSFASSEKVRLRSTWSRLFCKVCTDLFFFVVVVKECHFA